MGIFDKIFGNKEERAQKQGTSYLHPSPEDIEKERRRLIEEGLMPAPEIESMDKIFSTDREVENLDRVFSREYDGYEEDRKR